MISREYRIQVPAQCETSMLQDTSIIPQLFHVVTDCEIIKQPSKHQISNASSLAPYCLLFELTPELPYYYTILSVMLTFL